MKKPISRVKSGREFEKQVAEEYKKHGYIVWRPSWSKFGTKDILGLYDGICFNPIRKELVFWQAKKHKRNFTENIMQELAEFLVFKVNVDIAFTGQDKEPLIETLATFENFKSFDPRNGSIKKY